MLLASHKSKKKKTTTEPNQPKPHESSTCSFYNTTNIFKMLGSCIFARHLSNYKFLDGHEYALEQIQH